MNASVGFGSLANNSNAATTGFGAAAAAGSSGSSGSSGGGLFGSLAANATTPDSANKYRDSKFQQFRG